MKPYRSAAVTTPASLGILAAAVLAGAVAAGLLAHFVGQYFRPIIFFPIGMGLAAGLA